MNIQRILVSDLESVVLKDLRNVCEYVSLHEDDFIEKIIIFETEKIEGKKCQQVNIIYKFIGVISLAL